MDCIFCRIIAQEIPAKLAYEDENVLAFHDVSPAAPVHILVVPKKHIASLLDLTAQDCRLVSHIMTEVIPMIVKHENLDETGFRVVVNTGEDGGQTVDHLHFHLLGGRAMTWPPG